MDLLVWLWDWFTDILFANRFYSDSFFFLLVIITFRNNEKCFETVKYNLREKYKLKIFQDLKFGRVRNKKL